MWYHNSFFRYGAGIILVLLIVLLMYQTSFLFNPFIEFFSALFFPVLFAGILYYVLRPLVRLLESLRIPRFLAILATYLIVLIAIAILSALLGPIIIEQIGVITNIPPEKIDSLREKMSDLLKFFRLDQYSRINLQDLITAFLKKFYLIVSENVVSTITTITHFAVWLIITPFILYYMLKDDRTANRLWMRLVPKKYHPEGNALVEEIDAVLSTYITGQLLVACSLGFLLFIGYLIIGLNNAFILALFATVCITIPVFGSFIALIPALLVGLTSSPFMGLKVILVMLVAQILESNFISPQILARRLNIHPLVLLLILLASGSLYGILGLFLATPVFAALRTIIAHAYKFYRDDKRERAAKTLKKIQ